MKEQIKLTLFSFLIHFFFFYFISLNTYILSNAILQYLGDKYDIMGKLYPKDPKARAIINHRLCFNLAMYYRNISEYVVSNNKDNSI